jgi:hypothetical protein
MGSAMGCLPSTPNNVLRQFKQLVVIFLIVFSWATSHKIKAFGPSLRKLSSFLLPIKDDLTLKKHVLTAFPASVGKCKLDALDV